MSVIKPLSREEVISVIEGKTTASRVPIILDIWVHPKEFGDRQQQVRDIMARYPQDAQTIEAVIPEVFDAPADDHSYRWFNADYPFDIPRKIGFDETAAMQSWDQLDDVLADFPDPNYPGLWANNVPAGGRYRLGWWGFCLYERFWDLRGMNNALIDFYTEPDKVHKLFRALTDFYLVVIERAKKELNADGIFTSDDIGTQSGPFFSLDIFRNFFKPYYKEIIDKTHELGMHFWLHTCGNIELYLPDFIELGMDVIHPIQKYTMDEKNIAEKYGEDICIWAGFDVQQIIPWGSPQQVRDEVQFMFDTYYRPTEGKLMFTAGNGVNGDCTIESLEALYSEAYDYGAKVVNEKESTR